MGKTGEPAQWRDEPLPEAAWRAPAGLSAQARAAEQDEAAGGRERRQVRLPDGRWATASVALRQQSRSRKAWAYLRYYSNGKTTERYIGEASAMTRAENLRRAWWDAQDKGFLG